MQTHQLNFRILLYILLSSMIACSGNSPSGSLRMTLPDAQFSMSIPNGWTLDNDQMCHKGDYTGIVMMETLDGRSLNDRADEISAEFGSRVIATERLRISDRDAIRTSLELQSGDMMERLYLSNHDAIIWISFSVSKSTHPQEKQAIDHAFQSVKIR